MERNAFILANLLLVIGSCHCFTKRIYGNPLGFTPNVNRIPLHRSFRASTLPTIEELSSDPFMKQVSHSGVLVTQLIESNTTTTNEALQSRLEAQLSHSDGIRGFFATYLTHELSPNAVPAVLKQAMKSINNHEELVDLSFMNLIMPTAMVTMHKDPELSHQSRITADRGLLILQVLKEMDATKELVEREYKAILAVATGESHSSDSSRREAYWMTFFNKWGYTETQRVDIANALQRLKVQESN